MKKFIICILMIFSITVMAQEEKKEYLEGTAKVKYQDGLYALIDFTRTGRSYIVKNSDLKQGKKYVFLIVEKKKKGTRETATIIHYYIDSSQNVLDMRQVKDSISMILKTKWI